MKCTSCNDVELVNGRLEGISFVPERKEKKFMATGVYSIAATACPQCGRLTQLTLDPEALRKVLKK